MKIIEVIKEKQADWYGKPQPVIAFLGDSVTHGCFDLFVKNGKIETYVQSEKAYHEKVKDIFRTLYPDVPINIVNGGISGDNATNGITRLKRDILFFNPHLVVVCYGLNDAMSGESGLDSYLNSLGGIFDTVRESGAEVIFMTPNLRTDTLDVRFNDELINECAKTVIKNEKSGILEKYINEARILCKNKNVPVCDCNRLWQMLKDNDVNINNLLSNRINHPTEKMHWLFAYELVKTMFEK